MRGIDVSQWGTAGAFLLCGGAVAGHEGCDAILVEGSRVSRIGRSDEFAEVGTARRDVGGGAILPGFVDAHTHLVESGLDATGWRLDLAGRGRGETLERLHAAGRLRAGGEWLVAGGWDESRWTLPIPLERVELDRVTGETPTVAVRIDGHLAVANSRALALARGDLLKTEALVDAKRGSVREMAIDALLAHSCPDAGTIREALQAAAAMCHRLGITTAHVLTGRTDPRLVVAAAHALRLRVVVHPRVELFETLRAEEVRSGDGDEWGRWGGLKLFADGSIGARTAAVSLPYRDGGHGLLLLDTRGLARQIAAAERAGWQTLVHAIGDRAIGLVLEAHRAAGSSPGLVHRIEHFELPTPSQIEDTARLGLAVCMQPNFVANWSGPGRLYETALGPERDAASNPLREVQEAGIRLGFGSDGMPLSPLHGIDGAVRAPHDGQRLPLGDALGAYTVGAMSLSRGPAWAAGFAPGAPADLVVLDGALDFATVRERAVALTLVNGEVVYEAAEVR